MKKIYALFLASAMGLGATAIAQSSNFVSEPMPKKTGPTAQSIEDGLEYCTVMNYDAFFGDGTLSPKWYNYRWGNATTTNGYIFGANDQGATEILGYFDATDSTGDYISEAYYWFIFCNSSKPANMTTRNLYFNIYNALDLTTPGVFEPGDLLAQVPLTMQELADQDLEANYGFIDFASAVGSVPMPENRKFFVGYDYSELTWSAAEGNDTTNLATTNYALDATNQMPTNCWMNYQGTFYPLDQVFTIQSTIGIVPQLSCGSLPVKLLSFTGLQKNNDVVLNWNTTNEDGLKNYEVQKSINGVFATIGTVKAYNTLSPNKYSFVDKAAFASSSKALYRLKEINLDGKAKISYTVNVSTTTNNGIHVTVINPAYSAIQMQVSSAVAQNATIKVYDMKGQFTGVQSVASLSAGSQTITLQKAANLPAGMYMIDLLVDGNHSHYKVVKN